MNVDRVFFDTNVFVYVFDPDNTVKSELAKSLLRREAARGGAVFSYQVWQEFVQVSTRKFKQRASLDQTLEAFHHFGKSCQIVHSSDKLFARAYSLWTRFQFQWYDSLIVAAAVESGCKMLYSEDMHDGLDIDGMRIINPFKTPEAGLN